MAHYKTIGLVSSISQYHEGKSTCVELHWGGSGGKNTNYKGSEVGACLEYFSMSENASVTRL